MLSNPLFRWNGGLLIHPILGYMDAVEFVSLGCQANDDPKQQYATHYKLNLKPETEMQHSSQMSSIYWTGDRSKKETCAVLCNIAKLKRF
ncbi:MAG: hypothetical protein IPL13_17435 [Saprospiraceae bacterium]|nr:hypothetical protein [Candidatus Brachybacter algidus]